MGVVRALEKTMDTGVKIPVEPQVVGALGAALLAIEKT
jgi:activator of 2-hydroxyglutaryl-CoA dehydratase